MTREKKFRSSDLLVHMRRALTAGGDVIRQHVEQPPEVRFKGDGTPVTAADEESGQRIREVLAEIYPDCAMNDEEAGVIGAGKRMFYVDPIDGTTSFIRGMCLSTIGIALYEGKKPIAGAIYHPFEGEIVFAETGRGVWRQNAAASRSACRGARTSRSRALKRTSPMQGEVVAALCENFSRLLPKAEIPYDGVMMGTLVAKDGGVRIKEF